MIKNKDKKFIPVSCPALIGNEKKYVNDCLNSGWVSSIGQYIERFERKFTDYIGTKYAIACVNGTAALHLAFLCLGIKDGDEVICPTFTYIATANSIKYVGAKPIFVDCEPDTFNINPRKIERAITKKTKAIIIVHLYGHPCNMNEILKITKKHKLFLIEDAAEAIGSEYFGKRIGSFGDVAIFSFFGNKTLTTGEGGMILTNDKKIAQAAYLYKGQGMDIKRRYWFKVIGYNYRMTNIQSAIGLAQLENIEKFVSKRRQIAEWYNSFLSEIKEIELSHEQSYAKHSWWMYSILTKKIADRDNLMDFLGKRGIETRPFFYPMHIMPVYKKINKNKDLKIAENIAARGINLPTFYNLKENDIEYIAKKIRIFFNR